MTRKQQGIAISVVLLLSGLLVLTRAIEAQGRLNEFNKVSTKKASEYDLDEPPSWLIWWEEGENETAVAEYRRVLDARGLPLRGEQEYEDMLKSLIEDLTPDEYLHLVNDNGTERLDYEAAAIGVYAYSVERGLLPPPQPLSAEHSEVFAAVPLAPVYKLGAPFTMEHFDSIWALIAYSQLHGMPLEDGAHSQLKWDLRSVAVGWHISTIALLAGSCLLYLSVKFLD